MKENELDSQFKKSMKEAENIGAAHELPHEFKSPETDRIKTEQKKMWAIQAIKSKENWKKVNYIRGAKTVKDRIARIRETGIT